MLKTLEVAGRYIEIYEYGNKDLLKRFKNSDEFKLFNSKLRLYLEDYEGVLNKAIAKEKILILISPYFDDMIEVVNNKNNILNIENEDEKAVRIEENYKYGRE